jgi:hypothetical protein
MNSDLLPKLLLQFRTALLLEYMPEEQTRQPLFLLLNYFLVKSEDMELNNTTTTIAPDSRMIATMKIETTIDRQGPRIVAKTMGQNKEQRLQLREPEDS